MLTHFDSIHGHCEGIELGRFVAGWVFNDEHDGYCRISVQTPDGTPIASGLAQHKRPDLECLGLGRTNFAFRIPVKLRSNIQYLHVYADDVELPGSPLRIGPAQFDAWVSVHGGVVLGQVCERVIGGLPPMVHVEDQFGRVIAEGMATCPSTLIKDIPTNYDFKIPLYANCFGIEELELFIFANKVLIQRARAATSLRGYLDYVDKTRVSGWLLSPDASEHRFKIDVFCNEERIGYGVCDHPRQDLLESFPVNSESGFDIPIKWPSDMSGTALLSLRLSGSNTELFDGPFLLTERAEAIIAARNVAARIREEGRFSVVERSIVERALAEAIATRRSGPPIICERANVSRAPLVLGRRLNVIIPIYRGVEITEACIESVLATRNASRDAVVLVNDRSPEAGMSSMLKRFERLPNVFVLHNVENLGFVGAVNRGLNYCPDGHCVLLNSDTRVFPGIWDEFEKIIAENPSAGTITAFSNNATIFSYPHPNLARAEPLDDISWEDLAAEALARNGGRILDAPSGHGFCMLVRREVLDRIGHLDVRFGRGYGEENDLCQRAADIGWRNVVACGVFVEHRESVSFQSEKASLLTQNLKLLHSMYPEYTGIVMDHERSDPLRMARWPLDSLRLRRAREAGGSFALVFRHSLGGGTDVAINDLECAYGYEGRTRLTLTFRHDGFRELTCEAMNIFALFSPFENAQFFNLLDDAAVDLLLIHQLLGADESFIRDLTSWARQRNDLRMVFHIHDFYALCPRVTMFNAAGRFCAASESETCVRCVEMGGKHPSNRISLPSGEHRRIFGDLMRACAQIIAPSQDTLTWTQRIFPDQAITARPHPDTGSVFPNVIRRGDPNHIIVLGGIGQEKGSGRLREIAIDARMKFPHIHFHVIWYTNIDEELDRIGNISISGPYKRDELELLVGRANGLVALFLHEWPETFSYTLSEAWSLGLWPLVPNLGAPAERVRERGFGTVLPAITAETIDNELKGARWLQLDAGHLGQNYTSSSFSPRAESTGAAHERSGPQHQMRTTVVGR